MLKTDGITIRDWLHLIIHKINIEKTGSFDPVFLIIENLYFFADKKIKNMCKKICSNID